MFEPWHDYYLMLGPVAGALIGLLFVVVSLTGQMEHTQAVRGTQVYTTPVVFHLSILVLISSLALGPRLVPMFEALVILASAVAGIGYVVRVAWWMSHPEASQINRRIGLTSGSTPSLSVRCTWP